MKIAHTVEFYRPKIGGAERVVQQMSERLAARGHEVSVLTSRLPGSLAEEELDDVRVKRFEVRGNAVKGITGEIDRFRRELMESGYDVIFNYACQAWPTDLTFRWLDELDIATVLAPCGYSGLKQGRVKRLFYRRYYAELPEVLKKYDRVVYHSRSYIDWQLGMRWGLDNGTVIPNGVDLAEDQSLPQGEAEPPEVVSVGNHYRAKNHKDFFRLARLLNSSAQFRLVATPERYRRGCLESCREKARKTGVTLIDGRHRATVLGAIARSKVLVITSRLECSPLTALEAVAAGVPFVSYDVGCVRDWPGGLVVDSLDEMAGAVATLLRDDGLRRRLSEAGRSYVADLDWSSVAECYEALFLDIVSSRELAGSRP